MFPRQALFADRAEAGRVLARRLAHLAAERPVVLALPRGGVPVGFAVASALRAPLDLVLVRKIGAPFQPELAIGAVVDGSRPETVINDEMLRELEIPASYIAEEGARQLAEIERRRALYLAGPRARADRGPDRDPSRRWHRHRRDDGGCRPGDPAGPPATPRARRPGSAAGDDRRAAAPCRRDRLPRHAAAVRGDRRVLRGLPAARRPGGDRSPATRAAVDAKAGRSAGMTGSDDRGGCRAG